MTPQVLRRANQYVRVQQLLLVLGTSPSEGRAQGSSGPESGREEEGMESEGELNDADVSVVSFQNQFEWFLCGAPRIEKNLDAGAGIGSKAQGFFLFLLCRGRLPVPDQPQINSIGGESSFLSLSLCVCVCRSNFPSISIFPLFL